MDIVILKAKTPAEEALSNASQVLLHLDLCKNYCNLGKWGLAKEALMAAQASLQFVNQDLIEDADVLKRLVVGFRKMRNRIRIRE